MNGPKALDKVAITLPPAAALRGRVTDTKDKPVAGALVWTDGLHRRPNGYQPLEGVYSAQTDADGRYAINDLHAWDVAKRKPVMMEKAIRSHSAAVFSLFAIQITENIGRFFSEFPTPLTSSLHRRP